MKKRSLCLIIGLLSIICLSAVIFSQNNNQKSVIIVVGQNAAQSDYDTANAILANISNDYTITIVKDSDFVGDNTSTIISVGGSCINSLSAEILDVYYPTCTADFSLTTKVGPNQYLFKTYKISNNRVEVLIAGYEAEDTSNAGKYLMSKSINNLQPRMFYLGNSPKSS